MILKKWSTDVKLFPLAYNSQITTTLGLSSYEMVFNQKPREPILFTTNSSKDMQGYCRPTKDTVCYNLAQLKHNENSFQHPQIVKTASGTNTESISKRDKNFKQKHRKIAEIYFKDRIFNTKHIHASHQPLI